MRSVYQRWTRWAWAVVVAAILAMLCAAEPAAAYYPDDMRPSPGRCSVAATGDGTQPNGQCGW